MDIREVNFHRVVNIVEKRNMDLYDEQRYCGPHNFQEQQECYREGNYPPQDDCRYYGNNVNNNYFERYPSSQRNEGPYPQQCYAKDDLRCQLDSRSNGRPRYFRSRGGGKGPRRRAMDRKTKPQDFHKGSQSATATRHRSPMKREAGQPPGGSASTSSSSSSKSSTPNQDKALALQQPAQQKYKPSVSASLTPSSSAEGSPHSSGSSKEKAPASAVEETEEVLTASMEPQPTPEADDLKSCLRREAIESKALEIQKHYRQDCETFRTVVKMLVEKEPSLDKLLQAPLDKNLTEMKQRCLDNLKQYMKELDEVLEHPDT